MYFGINKVDKLISKAGFVIGWTLSCGGEEVTDQPNDPSWPLTGLTDTMKKWLNFFHQGKNINIMKKKSRITVLTYTFADFFWTVYRIILI